MVVVAVVFAVAAFLLGNVIWPASPEIAPTSGQLPFFILLSAVEALTFGIGMAFIIFGWNKSVGRRLVFLAVAWLLVSWWPHDSMHKHNGSDIGGLLIIEYLFHFTLMIAGVIVALDLWKQLRGSDQPQV